MDDNPTNAQINGKDRAMGGQGSGRPKEPEPPEYGDEAQLSELLSEMPKNWKMQVYRIAPREHDGLLETVELDPSEPIEIDDIRRKWGGRKLQIKIMDDRHRWRKVFSLKFPEDPLHNGKPYMDGQVPASMPSPAQTIDQGQHYKELMQMMMKMQEKQSEQNALLLERRLSSIEAAQAAAQSPYANPAMIPPGYLPAAAQQQSQEPTNPLSYLKEVVSTVQQIEELKKTLGVETKAGEEGGSMWEGVLKQFLDLELEKAKMKINPNQQKPPPELPERSATSQETNEPAGDKSESGFIDVVKQKLATMPQEKRDALMEIIFGDADIEIDSDDDEENDATERETSRNNEKTTIDLESVRGTDQAGSNEQGDRSGSTRPNSNRSTDTNG